MKEIVYWHQFDKPKKIFNPALKIEQESAGEYRSNDTRIKQPYIFGYATLGGDEKIGIKGGVLMQDGSRWESTPLSELDYLKEFNAQLEQYLKSL